MRTHEIRNFAIVLFAVGIALLSGGAWAAAPGEGANDPVRKVSYGPVAIPGISALQVSWWFDHIADKDGAFFKPLSEHNQSIHWAQSLQDSRGHNGAIYVAARSVAGVNRKLRVYYYDWKVVPKSPAGYAFPYPAMPLSINGHNQHQVIITDEGYVPARVVISYRDDGAGNLLLRADYLVNYMKGANRLPGMTTDGYAYTDDQTAEMWAQTRAEMGKLPEFLPGWFGRETLDDMARPNGYTVVGILDNPMLPGVDSKMIIWLFNHLGDAPGDLYRAWAPRDHRASRWLVSPAQVLGTNMLPKDRIVIGAIASDLQQSTGDDYKGVGARWYSNEVGPIRNGRYKNLLTLAPSAPGDESPRKVFLTHSFEDVPGGAMWRTTRFFRIGAFPQPLTQAVYQLEHPWYEGGEVPNFLPRFYAKAPQHEK